MELNKLIKKVESLIIAGQISEAVGALLDALENMDHQSFRQVNMISSQFREYRSNKIMGLKRDDDLGLDLNRIRAKLLDLLDSMVLKSKEKLFQERMQESPEIIHAKVHYQTGRLIAFIIYVNDVRHSLEFRTNYVKDDIFVNNNLIHKERNYFKYSQFYDFTLSSGDYIASFRLVVKFSIWTGLIKRFQLVSKRAILCEGKI